MQSTVYLAKKFENVQNGRRAVLARTFAIRIHSLYVHCTLLLYPRIMSGKRSICFFGSQKTFETRKRPVVVTCILEYIQFCNLLLKYWLNFKQLHEQQMSRHVGKPTICIGENKGADQLRSNCEADQRLCFRYSDSTIPLLLKSEISSF